MPSVLSLYEVSQRDVLPGITKHIMTRFIIRIRGIHYLREKRTSTYYDFNDTSSRREADQLHGSPSNIFSICFNHLFVCPFFYCFAACYDGAKLSSMPA